MQERQGTVLYVDDDDTNRYAFTRLFREAGFDVQEAATGEEALRLAASKPDLVILDVNLPDINGFEVCRRIKSHPATTAIPVMHMSGVYLTPEERTHALEEGADAYLTKPVEPGELIAQAKALLRIRQAEEKALASARQWQATFNAINDGVCLLDDKGRVLRCNSTLAQILGKSPDEILGATWYELTASPAGVQGGGNPPSPPAPGQAATFLRMLETRHRESADLLLGGRWLQTVADPILEENGTLTGAVCILTDVTEHKRLEEQLRQQQKMEAMGQLAAGITHDFNNLLTIITGNISLLLAGMQEGDSDRELLLAVEHAAWRAAELTRQLLGFARQSTPRMKPTNLRSCLEEVVGIVRRTFDTRITVEARTCSDLWTVQANPGQINQVLLNLCLNARDAMPEGGQLVLEAENVVLDEGQAQQHTDGRPGEFVRLRVRDTGHGIPPNILPRIFEPFYTTKEVGKGTGLGLAVVFGIIRQHHGWIECQSVVRASESSRSGTCFDVYLPRAGEAAGGIVPPAPAPEGPAPDLGGGPEGTIPPALSPALSPAEGEKAQHVQTEPNRGESSGVSEEASAPSSRTTRPTEFCWSGLEKEEAEQLLDWLEARGHEGWELSHEEGRGFAIRWRDDEQERRCRRRHRRPCPECGSLRRPYMVRKMTALSWMLVVIGLVLWPLLIIGILLRVDVWRCWVCHRELGRGRWPSLGW